MDLLVQVAAFVGITTLIGGILLTASKVFLMVLDDVGNEEYEDDKKRDE